MKFYILDNNFYNKKFKEILKLKDYEIIRNNEGSRPYFYSIDINNKIILLPLRSNSSKISRANKFSTKKVDKSRTSPAIDFTSLLVINRNENLFLKEIILYREVSKFIKKNEKHLQKKFNNYILRYIKDKALLIDTKTTDRSSLKYFHKELNLDEKIMNKRKSILINELEKNGESKFFKKLASTVENTEKITKLYNYKSLLEIDGRLDPKSNFDNPKLILNTKDSKKKIEITFDVFNKLIENNPYTILDNLEDEKKIFDIKLSDKEELNDTVNVKPIKRKSSDLSIDI